MYVFHFSSFLREPQNSSAGDCRSDKFPVLLFRLQCGHNCGIPIPLLHFWQILLPSPHSLRVHDTVPHDVSQSLLPDEILQPAPEILLPLLFCKSVIHICPLVILSICCRCQILCRIADSLKFFKPHFCMFFLIVLPSSETDLQSAHILPFWQQKQNMYTCFLPVILLQKLPLSFFSVCVPAYLFSDMIQNLLFLIFNSILPLFSVGYQLKFRNLRNSSACF